MPGGARRRGVPLFSRGRWGLVVSVFLLWGAALLLFSRASIDTHFRIDRGEAVAYPMSDALNYYLNGIAFFSGDGWVNWREDTRWSVDKPGWGLALGFLNTLLGGDSARVQRVLTLLFGLVGPAFFFLILSLYRGPRRLSIAFGSSLLFLLFAPLEGWGLARTMMTELPTLLLALLFCGLVVRFGSWPVWNPSVWFGIGMLGAAPCLVREQSRYGLALVVLLLLALVFAPRTRRLRGWFALVCGALVLLGPFYLKTSYHLGTLYTGTSYTSLRAVLDYSPAGKAIGGAEKEERGKEPEAVAIAAMKGKANEALSRNWAQPGRVLREAVAGVHRYFFGGLAKRIGFAPENPVLGGLIWALCVAGWGWSLCQRGPVALAPALFVEGYLLPSLLFSYHLDRFGLPVSFLGWAGVAGAVLLPLQGKRAWKRWLRFPPRCFIRPQDTQKSNGRNIRHRRWGLPVVLGVGTTVWLGGCSGFLLWNDLHPPAAIDVEGILKDPLFQARVREAGWEPDEELQDILTKAQSDLAGYPKIGHAFLPFRIAPGEETFTYSWKREGLAPREEVYTAVYVYIPWKRRGSLGRSQRYLRAEIHSGFRQGEEVLVLPDKTDPGGFYSGAVIPLPGSD